MKRDDNQLFYFSNEKKRKKRLSPSMLTSLFTNCKKTGYK